MRYEFGGRKGCCAFSEIIEADSIRDAEIEVEKWCSENDAVCEYIILAQVS